MSESLKKISQRNFTAGVSASAQDFAQPKNSIARASNLLFTKRGALVSCDGTQVITLFNGAFQKLTDNFGPLTETFLYEPIGQHNEYYAIGKDYNTSIGVPIGFTAADGGAGGNLSAGTYSWRVTALDGAGGETTGSAIQTLVLAANHKGSLHWTVVPFAAGGYNVYRTVANGSTFFLVATVAQPTVGPVAYVDNVADADLGAQQLPNVDTTQVTHLYHLTAPSYDFSQIVQTYPADLPIEKGGTGGEGGGSTSGGTTGMQPPTTAGGITGTLSQLPQIVQFDNVMILALGNGFNPQKSDGTTPGSVALNNTFTASYPARANSTAQAIGDLIADAGTLYKAVQGGTTAAGPPVFHTVKGATTADGSVIWQSQGPISSVPAPPGAAHCIVYAGCLWVFNTAPDNTASGLDGPSALRMSDLNNPDSWNPLNTAFLDKDDGSQGMGLAVFTIAEAGIAPTGSLVAFKEFSTFQIIGVFGASDFSIQRAQTDMGCVAPRTIQFVPGFVIVRLTHLGFAVFDGVRDRIISEQIRPYIFGGLPDVTPADWNYIWFSKGAMTAQPPMYVCALPLRNIIHATSPLTFTLGSDLIGGIGFPAGTYYITVQGISADGNTYTDLTGEQTVTVFGIHRNIVVNLPANAGFATWKILIGSSGAGSETQYITAPGTQTTVTMDGNTNLFLGAAVSNFGQMKRIVCFDLVLKGWTVVDLPFAISTLKQYRSVGTIPITTMTGFSDGAFRRWQLGDETWDDGALNAGATDTDIHYFVRSAEVFGQNASDRVYFRRISLRGVGDPTGLTATFTTNGLAGVTTSTQNFSVMQFSNGEFAAYADLHITCVDAYVRIDGATDNGFEIDSIDWSYVPKPVGGLVVAG